MLALAAALVLAAPPSLEDALLAAVREAGFDALHDAGPEEGPCPGGPGCAVPLPRGLEVRKVDLAVIRLDAGGRALEAANVQLDAASPRGRAVKLDANLAAPADAFMAPYPASLFKLLVAFHAARRWADGDYPRDVRPCNATAEVRFLHKTGLTWNYASDAGIVESLPGKPGRRYVIAAVTSTGTRWLDPERAAAARHPCEAESVCLPRALSRVGAAVDAWMVARGAVTPPVSPSP